MDLAVLSGSSPLGDEQLSFSSSAAPSPTENSATASNVLRSSPPVSSSYGGRLERSLDTYATNKKGAPPHRGSSPNTASNTHTGSTTPTTLLKGLRDPGRSYEDLLADSPPASAAVAEPVLYTPPPQALSQQHQQHPWSLLMRRQLAQALTQTLPPEGGRLSAPYGCSPTALCPATRARLPIRPWPPGCERLEAC